MGKIHRSLTPQATASSSKCLDTVADFTQLDGLPALSAAEAAILKSYARTLAHLELPGGNISFQRALVAKERTSRSSAEIHVDYIASSVGYWPVWAEKPQFASRVFQSWITARGLGILGENWICQNASTSQESNKLRTLNQTYEKELRNQILDSEWYAVTYVVPKETAHSVFANPDTITNIVLDDFFPAPKSTIRGELPHIERWQYVNYTTTILPEPLYKIISDSSITDYSIPVGKLSLPELAKIKDNEALALLLYLSTSLEEPNRGLGKEVSEQLTKTFVELLKEHLQVEVAKDMYAVRDEVGNKTKISSGGKIVILASESEIAELGRMLPEETDALKTIIDLTYAFADKPATIKSPSGPDLSKYTLRFPHIGEGWIPDLFRLFEVVARSGMTIVGVIISSSNVIRSITTENKTLKEIITSPHQLPSNLYSEIADIGKWAEAYDMPPIAPGRLT